MRLSIQITSIKDQDKENGRFCQEREWFIHSAVRVKLVTQLQNWVTTGRKEENVTSMEFQSEEWPMYESVSAEPRGQVWVAGRSGWLVRVVVGVWSGEACREARSILEGRCAHALSRVTELPLAGLSFANRQEVRKSFPEVIKKWGIWPQCQS